MITSYRIFILTMTSIVVFKSIYYIQNKLEFKMESEYVKGIS